MENRSNRNSIGSINQRSRGYDIVIEVKWEKDIAEAYLSNASPFVPRERGASMQAEVTENPDTGNPVIRFEDIAWDGSSNRLLYTVFYDDGEKTDYELAIHQAVALRESEDPSAPSPGESSSRPFWERVSAADRRGTELSSITKDTEPFTLSITYVDEGLNGLYFTGNDVSRFRVYLTGGGFAARGSNRGSITRLPSSSSEPPRFRVDFRDVIWLGESNQIIFRVIYNIEDFTIDENVTATAYQAREEKSEDETKPPSPLTPYIIITDFSAGEGLIEPGQSFELSLKFRNTSTQIPLENIVMTIDPGAGFSLASGSAAHFITGLAAGAEREQVIGLEAKPEAAAGSHPIAVKFSYQYFVQTAGDAPPELVSLESPGAVALVISQVDRFSAEPIE
ncbi:MAG: hypothetical protein FWH02_07825 [Oscillospiraceae bacterium]|nr:hypothetical protein [Oscillospiraceae bacterium]